METILDYVAASIVACIFLLVAYLFLLTETGRIVILGVGGVLGLAALVGWAFTRMEKRLS